MEKKLFAVHIPLDAHPDEVSHVIGEAFGGETSSFSTDGLVHHFLDLTRSDDMVMHVETGRVLTVKHIAELLQPHCAFLRESSFAQNPRTGRLERV